MVPASARLALAPLETGLETEAVTATAPTTDDGRGDGNEANWLLTMGRGLGTLSKATDAPDTATAATTTAFCGGGGRARVGRTETATAGREDGTVAGGLAAGGWRLIGVGSRSKSTGELRVRPETDDAVVASTHTRTRSTVMSLPLGSGQAAAATGVSEI